MKSFFVRLFVAFILVQFVSMILLFTTLAIGFRYSLSDWEKSYQKAVTNRVREALQKIYLDQRFIWESGIRNSFKNFYLDGIEIFFYVSKQGPLVSIRGEGNNLEVFLPISADALKRLPIHPIKTFGETSGFFAIDFDRFQNMASNQKFIDSLTQGSIISLTLSFVLSLVIAYVMSRNFSAKSVQTVQAIQNIAEGDLHVDLPETGPWELSEVSRAINILSEKLAREKQLRDQWIQDIAHDLRTPVCAMKAQLEALADGVLALTPERLERNLKQLSRIENLVCDLSEIMKLESPEIKLKKERIFFSLLVNEILLRFSAHIIRKNIAVIKTCPNFVLYADEKLLNRCLVNIIDNAIKYCNDNGTLRINGDKNGKEVSLVVGNTGSYIPKKECTKVFDRLYRSEQARNADGSGLGLTIAKKIVDLHGGTIVLESEKHVGTSVRMSLPVSELSS